MRVKNGEVLSSSFSHPRTVIACCTLQDINDGHQCNNIYGEGERREGEEGGRGEGGRGDRREGEERGRGRERREEGGRERGGREAEERGGREMFKEEREADREEGDILLRDW